MGDCLCPFCRGYLESREHLFFECGFSFRIWKNLLALCLVADLKRSWEDIEKWGIVELRNDSLWSRLCILSLGAAVYNL
jgi:hypothetical protein